MARFVGRPPRLSAFEQVAGVSALPAPTVSVILPTRDRAGLLAMSAGSVLAQTYRDLELIVVDDGSREDIESAVRALGDSRARYLRRSETGGPAAARNDGLRAARGRLVAFQDSDDEWLLDKLELQVQTLEDNRGDGMCVCGLLRRLSGRVRPYAPRPVPPSKYMGFADIAAQPITYTQTWLAPRKALLDAGGFDERLRVWEDWELLLRLAQRLRIRTLDRPLVLSEQAADSLTHDNGAFLEALALILDKHAEALARHRRRRAGLHYARARLLIYAERMGEARRSLLRAVIDRPWHVRAWALLGGSALGADFVNRRLQAVAARTVEAGR